MDYPALRYPIIFKRVELMTDLRWVHKSLLLSFTLLVSGFISLCLGQDNMWDLRNYHLYNPWAYLNDRLETDIFVSGIQFYFSPFFDIPYYLLSTDILSHWPRVLAFIMGFPFGLLVYGSFVVSWIVTRSLGLSPRIRIAVCLMATVFSASSTAIISEIGSASNDIQVAVIVIFGLVLLLKAANVEEAQTERKVLFFLALSGLIFGIAAGLKLTAIVYPPGAAIVAFMPTARLKRRLARFLMFSVTCLIAFTCVWGPWGLDIYRLTGNPFFPIFNNIFHSDWIKPGDWRDLHAMPAGLVQKLFFPFYWAKPTFAGMDNEFADPRFAVVYIFFIFYCARRILEKISGNEFVQTKADEQRGFQSIYLLVFFIVSYVLWESVFSLQRYLIPLEAISGAAAIACCAGAYKKADTSRLVNIGSAACVTIIPVLTIVFSQYPHFGRVKYADKVFDVEVPSVKPDSVVVYIDPPGGFISPYIWSNEKTVKFVGYPSYLISPEFGGFRLKRKIIGNIRSEKNIYVVFYKTDDDLEGQLDLANLKMDQDTCRPILTNISGPLSICEASREEPQY